MIGYILRVYGLALAQRRLPRLAIDAPHVYVGRAWPKYCDQNLHINNAHYLTFMDYGRVGWLMRTGVLEYVFREKIALLVAGLDIVYRREIRWWQRFELDTRLAGMDDRWVYVVQTFRRRDGLVAARALLRFASRKDGAPYPFADVLEAIGQPVAAMPPSPELAAWIAATEAGATAIKELEA